MRGCWGDIYVQSAEAESTTCPKLGGHGAGLARSIAADCFPPPPKFDLCHLLNDARAYRDMSLHVTQSSML
jgi:hypothetical protein